jgi:hypothetical protein
MRGTEMAYKINGIGYFITILIHAFRGSKNGSFAGVSMVNPRIWALIHGSRGSEN